MSDEERVPGAPVPETSTVTGSSSSAPPPPPIPETPPSSRARRGSEQAWDDVVSSLDDLGAAVTAWARSMTDNPQNRTRAQQLKEALDGMGRQLGDVVETATKTNVASELGAALLAAGGLALDTARRVGDEVGPHLAGAFKSAAEGLREAAERMEQHAKEAPTGTGAQPATPPGPTPPKAPYSGEEPPAPSPSGVGDDYVP